MRRGRVTLSSAFIALAAATSVTLTGCTDPESEVQTYCGDVEQNVLPEDRCDGDDDPSSAGFIYIGHYFHTVDNEERRYRVGERLPRAGRVTSMSSLDTTSRTSLGLPSRGGFGSNGATIALKGGSGGG